MRPYSRDHAWACLSYSDELAGQAVPRLWVTVYRFFRRLLLWGPR